jgi:hypothetical protein
LAMGLFNAQQEGARRGGRYRQHPEEIMTLSVMRCLSV